LSFDSILAGFAITIVIQLIVLGKKDKIASASIAVFIISTAFLLISITGTYIVLQSAGYMPAVSNPPTELAIMKAGGGIGFPAVVGLLMFMVGVALVGWLYSKGIGIVSTSTMILSLILIIVIIIQLFS